MTPSLDARGLAIADRLKPTDLRAETPQILCLVGPNGSGKTSLLHALAGIGSAEGEVRIGVHSLSHLADDERKRLLAFLPASRDIAWPVTGRSLVELGLPAGAGEEDAERALAELDAVPLADRRIDRLSTGERSRILIARALAPRPRVLLLDEPAANLDPYWQLRLMALLRALSSEQIVVAAMHDLDLAARFADRMLVLDGGRVVADGPPATLVEGEEIRRVFGIQRRDGAWDLINPTADRQSSP